MEKNKPGRAYFYRGVSILMAAGIAGLLLIKEVFWAEVWGLTLFGIGRLVAGSYKSDGLRYRRVVCARILIKYFLLLQEI